MGGSACDCEHDILKLNGEVIDLLKEFASWGGGQSGEIEGVGKQCLLDYRLVNVSWDSRDSDGRRTHMEENDGMIDANLTSAIISLIDHLFYSFYCSSPM